MWEPLHLDEAVMLQFSRESLLDIVKHVFVDRGGAPAQFVVEHATLVWPGGLVGLRAPSLVFLVLALPLAAAVARRLVGEEAGLAVPILLALAPLTVGLATFARMYALFLLCVLGVTWLGLRAADRAGGRSWAVAGAAAGALVYVHPIAPLYAPLALCAGIVARGRGRPPLAELRPALVAGAVVVAPYLYALAVLGSRYHVGEASRLQTTAGRPVALESLYSLAVPGPAPALLFGALATFGLVLVARRTPALGALLAAWVLVPIVFFSVVPAQTRFFGRYLLPGLPAFLLLVVAGCVGLGRLTGRPAATVALAVLLLAALDVRHDLDRLRRLHALGLPALAAAVPRAGVLFSSTGAALDNRPAELLDDYVALRRAPRVRVEELPAIDPRFESGLVGKGRAHVVAFLRSGAAPARGAWILSGRPARVDALARHVGPTFATVRITARLAVVVSRRPAPPVALVREGLAVRTAWGLATPADRWARVIASVDRSALSGS